MADQKFIFRMEGYREEVAELNEKRHIVRRINSAVVNKVDQNWFLDS